MEERPDDPHRRPAPWLVPLQVGARVVLSIVLILYTLLDSLLFPALRPLLTALGRLGPFEAIAVGIGRLPPYAALVTLGIPFVIIEPVKLFALYWTGAGHWVQGLVLLLLAYVLSILVVDRIYHAAHAPLMRIGWFRRLMGWLADLRKLGTDWAKSTALWQAAARLALAAKTAVRGWLGASA